MKPAKTPIQTPENTLSPPACGRESHLVVASGVKVIERPDTENRPVEDELGHWRNRWDVPEKHAHLARRQGALPLGDGTWLGYRRFPTSKEAEDVAQKFSQYNFMVFSIRYVGPEFFPDY